MFYFIKYFSFLLLISFLLNGCASRQVPLQQPETQSITERNKQLLTLIDWKISGKIAFIEKNKRQSASLQWHNQQSKQQQTLNLTTILGINVFHLESDNGYHQIKVDGKTYQGKDLPQLIHSFTGLTLPIQALTFWLKGLAYNKGDQITYHPDSQLPSQLISQYEDKTWTITYDKYQWQRGYHLASKFTISQQNVLIKIVVNNWQL